MKDHDESAHDLMIFKSELARSDMKWEKMLGKSQKVQKIECYLQVFNSFWEQQGF